MVGRGADHAPAAGQHLVAIGNGKIGRQRAAGQHGAPRAGDGNKLRRYGRSVQHQRAMAVLSEYLGVGDLAAGKLSQPHFQLLGSQQPGVVLKQAHELAAAILERQAMEVADVDDHRVRLGSDGRIAQRAQHRGRRRVHHQQRDVHIGRGLHHCLQASHDRGCLACGKGEGAQVRLRPQPVGEIVQAKLAVADVGRGIAVVEHSHHDRVGAQVETKGQKGLRDGCEAEVAQLDHADVGPDGQPGRLVVADDQCAEVALHGVKIVVEAACGVGCGEDRQAGAVVILRGPTAGPASHGDAGQQQRVGRGGSLADRAGNQHGRGGHHQFEAVLGRARAVEQENVLGACTDVNCEDLHCCVLRRHYTTRDNAHRKRPALLERAGRRGH